MVRSHLLSSPKYSGSSLVNYQHNTFKPLPVQSYQSNLMIPNSSCPSWEWNTDLLVLALICCISNAIFSQRLEFQYDVPPSQWLPGSHLDYDEFNCMHMSTCMCCRFGGSHVCPHSYKYFYKPNLYKVTSHASYPPTKPIKFHSSDFDLYSWTPSFYLTSREYLVISVNFQNQVYNVTKFSRSQKFLPYCINLVICIQQRTVSYQINKLCRVI